MSSPEIATNNVATTQVVEVPLHLIKPSKSNPRKQFVDLNDLANSIRQNGVQQPLLVRPHPTIEGAFDLVAGERRWRASKLAEKSTAPCIVKPLTDEEALDLQMVENVQREDLSPLEAAEGYAKLLKKHGDIATVAAKVGKEISASARANRRVEAWNKEQPMLVLGRIAKATVEAAKKVKISSKLLRQILSLTSAEAFNHVYSDRYREIGKVFGLEAAAEKNHSGRDWQTPLEKFTADNPVARLVLTYSAHNFGEHSATKIRAIAKLFKVDVAGIDKDAQRELAARTQEELARARKSEARGKETSASSAKAKRSTP